MSPLQNQIIKDIYGPGTFVETEYQSIPDESRRILHLLAAKTPGFVCDDAILSEVTFHGDDLSLIPGPLKSQALSAALQGVIGIVCKEILALRNIDTDNIIIDTDLAGLYSGTVGLATVDGRSMMLLVQSGDLARVGVDVEGDIFSNHVRSCSWALYPTKDKHVWYQLIGNLDTAGFLRAYGIDPDTPTTSKHEAYDLVKAEISKYSAPELELKNMVHGFTGQTCYTPQQWRDSDMRKSLARHPLIEYQRVMGTEHLPPVPFPMSSDSRPLAGIRVVELARVIAAPSTGIGLTALGAEVIAIQSPNLPNINALSLTLNTDKTTFSIDLRNPEDKKRVEDLIDCADVILQAFRLHSLERKGFGLGEIVEMSKKRNKGVVYVDLNCYGPHGYYAERPGFQQAADAATGCSYVCGKALGFEDGTPVVPALPISDTLTGAVAIIDVLLALRDRAKVGGSYHAFASLCAVDALQVSEDIRLYSPETVSKVQEKYKFSRMTPDLGGSELLAVMVEAWKRAGILDRAEYFTTFPETPFGKNVALLKPITKFENASCSPRWDHGPVPYCYHREASWS